MSVTEYTCTRYRTEDGSTFDVRHEADAHDLAWSGKRALRAYVIAHANALDANLRDYREELVDFLWQTRASLGVVYDKIKPKPVTEDPRKAD